MKNECDFLLGDLMEHWLSEFESQDGESRISAVANLLSVLIDQGEFTCSRNNYSPRDRELIERARVHCRLFCQILQDYGNGSTKKRLNEFLEGVSPKMPKRPYRYSSEFARLTEACHCAWDLRDSAGFKVKDAFEKAEVAVTAGHFYSGASLHEWWKNHWNRTTEDRNEWHNTRAVRISALSKSPDARASFALLQLERLARGIP